MRLLDWRLGQPLGRMWPWRSRQIEHRGVLVSHAPNTHSRQSLTLKQPGRRIRRAIVHDGGPEKVELKPETLLAHAMHIAAADAAVERALRGDQPFS